MSQPISLTPAVRAARAAAMRRDADAAAAFIARRDAANAARLARFGVTPPPPLTPEEAAETAAAHDRWLDSLPSGEVDRSRPSATRTVMIRWPGSLVHNTEPRIEYYTPKEARELNAECSQIFEP